MTSTLLRLCWSTDSGVTKSAFVARKAPGGTLGPAERVAFVLHDMFAVPFDEVAAIVGRSPAAARQLASRARRRDSRRRLDGRGEPRMVFSFTIVDGKITGIDMIADPDRIGEMDIVY